MSVKQVYCRLTIKPGNPKLAPRVVDVLVSPQGLDVLSGGLQSPEAEGCSGGSAGHSAGTQVPASGQPSRLEADSASQPQSATFPCRSKPTAYLGKASVYSNSKPDLLVDFIARLIWKNTIDLRY
jgi:hypothetical protein